MNHDDIEGFQQRMTGLCELYDVRLSDARTELYWSALSDISIPDFDQAIRAHVQDSDRGRFFPKPADLLAGAAPDVDLRAAEAWRLVVENAGRFQRAEFADRLIHAVLRDLGGWARIGRAPERELGFLRRDFVGLYARHAQHGVPYDVPQSVAYASGYAGPPTDTIPMIGREAEPERLTRDDLRLLPGGRG